MSLEYSLIETLLNTLRSRQMPAGHFIVMATVLNLALYHSAMVRYVIDNLDVLSVNGVRTVLTLIVVVFVATTLVFSFLCLLTPHLLKAFCMLAAIANACAVYFMVTYAVMLDKSMMGNIFNTRSEESFDFLHPRLFLFIILLGVIPAWLISRVRILPVGRIRLFSQTAGLLIAGLLFIYLNSSTWLWFDRHAKYLGGRILPWSYISNTIRFKIEENRGPSDLTLLPAAEILDDSPVLVVLVIGETARSKNFSLYGYERETNPLLARMDVAVLTGTQACSTYTTASLHCMLSHTGKTSGSDEPLPSYLQRHGVNVIWRTNNWGEPPLDVGTYQKAGELKKTCFGEHCEFDDVLLNDLEKQINNASAQRILLTLHTKGSHGPSYASRYPEKFNVFAPVCQSVELSECSEQSLINAYDNTILYTDDFLSRAIQLLDGNSQIPTVLIYISDHGESLGEYGLYLHGTPYAIAPDVQKDIPFIVWMSDSFQSIKGISHSDLERRPENSHSQIFHSILGVLGIKSAVYRADQDMFKSFPPTE